MSTILGRGVIRGGQVVVSEPIDLPDGAEVTISTTVQDKANEDGPPTTAEIAAALAAMELVEAFDMTDEERAAADAWERKVNQHTIANTDKGIGDVFR
jgi:hypothetical protein